jgi:hypothetical protein
MVCFGCVNYYLLKDVCRTSKDRVAFYDARACTSVLCYMKTSKHCYAHTCGLSVSI